MPIWWRIVDLPASIETLPPDNHDVVIRGAAADAVYADLGPRQLFVLYVSSVIAGGLSLISTIIAMASFLRMRRSFRHDLILLLILSDLLKTLWLVILPATELVQGTVASTSSLCQISGYFLSVGIEACDLAVLLMAVHTGLYIFRGRTGLYPFRFFAYAIVAVVSLMLASLSFINKPAFVNSGPYCYLPSQPDWTSRALSWIPRYVILVTIMLTYTCIYAYVRWVMTKSEEPGRLQNANEPGRVDGHHVQEPYPLPPTPPIAYHGLIPPSPPCDRALSDQTLVGTSRLTLLELSQQNEGVGVSTFVKQRNERTKLSPKKPASPKAPSNRTAPSSHNDRYEETSNGYIHPHHAGGHEQFLSTARSMTVTPQQIIPPYPTTAGGLLIRAQTGPILDNGSSDISREDMSLPHLVLSSTTLNATGMPRVREKIRRQLGQLFVYPLVYMTGWLIPFISHVMGGDKTGRPFWLVLAGLISLCVQGMADSVVFLMMEKPWRYWTRDDVTAWWCIPWCEQSSMKGNGIKVGRTREEMLIDGTIARRRREREQAERRLLTAGRGPVHRYWWDLTPVGIDESSDEEAQPARTMR